MSLRPMTPSPLPSRPLLLVVALAAAWAGPTQANDATRRLQDELMSMQAENEKLDQQLRLVRQIEDMRRQLAEKRAALIRSLNGEDLPAEAQTVRERAGQPTLREVAAPAEPAASRNRLSTALSGNAPRAQSIEARPAAPAAVYPGGAAPVVPAESAVRQAAEAPARTVAPRSLNLPAPAPVAAPPAPGPSLAERYGVRPAAAVPAPTGGQAAPAAAPAPRAAGAPALSPRERQDTERRIADLKARMSGWLDGGASYRQRSGTEGLSTLSEVDLRAEASTVLGSVGRVTASATVVNLDAGGPASSADAALVGTNLGRIGTPITPDSTATGLALNLQLDQGSWQVDVGTTPLGFPLSTWVGGLAWSPPGTPLRLELARRPITDSLLSYAGLDDPVSGDTWGGVISHSVQLGAYASEGDFRPYGSVLFGTLNGTDVVSNRRFQANAGVRVPLDLGSDQDKVELGADLLVMGYQRNLSGFTYGHGGYFSPREYYRPSLTAGWRHDGGDAVWSLKGRLGWQMASEDDSPYFPNRPSLQRSTGNRFYEAQRNTGAAYGLEGAAAWRMSPQLKAGGWLRTEYSPNYNDVAGGLYVQYFFDGQPRTPVLHSTWPGGTR
ncbi:cellulose synthase subunit BcsC-related outer membrane protein [Aquariibacter albus]|uniref:BCSC C-terminal domain-containing protein n=1 Tax=Aquariibacter albus TaxID=2759899 RepID=A0A839HTW0_9BURK|nr:cellulose synthase subunit BcsC-related outer membrane protein [Aquariibacter albus]MBB1161434.1 BCSC C-terminal domain-containing protein [Aquariibacter albus]